MKLGSLKTAPVEVIVTERTREREREYKKDSERYSEQAGENKRVVTTARGGRGGRG